MTRIIHSTLLKKHIDLDHIAWISDPDNNSDECKYRGFYIQMRFRDMPDRYIFNKDSIDEIVFKDQYLKLIKAWKNEPPLQPPLMGGF